MTTTTAPPSDSVTLTINGEEVTAKKGTLLVEAARQAGIHIPVFCYHEKLKPVGACRMCLVQIEKMPRLQTACTTPVGQGMIVHTQSDMAKGGQQSVIALLLANHPLDCPVCDKGGECPLQDNTFGYGAGESKFEEDKRHKDKAFELSDKIVLDKERCILCYRCVRFHEEIPGDRALAVIDRGGYGEIGVLPGETYDSPFQGNTIDICPVGALTSRQYRFRARPWDLEHTDSIACDDPVGSNIVVDTRDGRVLRVRPRENLEVNDAWISDATRFGTVPQERGERLSRPLVRGDDGKLAPASWADALARAGAMMKKGRTGFVAAPTVTNEAMGALALLGDSDAWVTPSSPWPLAGRIADIAISKSIVVVGLDVTAEIPMLGLWIHRAVAPTAAGPGGAKLVVVNETNGPENGGMARDAQRFIRAAPADLKAALARLVDDVERGAGAGADLKARPATLLFSEQLARDPEARPLLEKLAGLLELPVPSPSGATEGEIFGVVGAPATFVNARGAHEIFGARADKRGFDTLVVVGEPTVSPGQARAVWLAHALPDLEHEGGPDVDPFVDVVLPLAHPYEQAGSFTNLEGRAQHFDAAGVPPGASPAGHKQHGAVADWLALARLAAEVGVDVPPDLMRLREHLAGALTGSGAALFKRIPKPRRGRLQVVS